MANRVSLRQNQEKGAEFMGSSALIAMSGGVDSSVAALLTLEQGHDCIGAMMKLFSNDDIDACREDSCCSLEDAEDARAVAYKLGMPFYVFNFGEDFKEQVIDRFIDTYQRGETPNPCIDCNRYLKFERLLHRAKELKCDYVVTGHYARREKDETTERYLLKKGLDETKDQSYVLYSMTQDQLKHTLLPLGGLRKTEVREIAQAHGFVTAEKKESQDICFVTKDGYPDFIRQYTGKDYPAGTFVDTFGNVLGKNKGIIHYTVGQRKGLGLSAPDPLYVCSVNAETNTVVVGTEDKLYAKALVVRDANLISVENIDAPLKVGVKIRYKSPEQPATVCQLDATTLRVEFDEPQKAIAKGQAAVCYQGDSVLGGGTIHEVLF